MIGIIGLAVFALLILRLDRYIRDRQPFRIQLELTLLFCFGTALITALARAILGVVQAFSSHYQTIALLFWCCIALLMFGEPASRGASRRGNVFPLMEVVLLCIIVVAATFWQTPLRRARLRGFGLNAAAMALVTEVPDASLLRWAYPPNPAYVMSFVPMLREDRLSVFAGMQSSLLGQPLESRFRQAASDECAGHLESIVRITGTASRAVRITGWAWDDKHKRPPSMIVATSDGIIVGLGAVGDWRPDVRQAQPKVSSDYTGFTGYVRDAQSSTPLKVYAVLYGSPQSACLFATAE